MKILSLKIHGLIDYASVLVFAFAPSVLGLHGIPATLSYALAVIHFLMTFHTRFPLGVPKKIPFRVHAVVELIVSVTLVVAAQTSAAFNGAARPFFTAMGAAIFVVWLLSRHE